jgi:hypothetical protein
MDSVTEHMTNDEIRISSLFRVSWIERGGDRLLREMRFENEMTADDSQKRHFAPALPMIEIVLRLADVGFQECNIRGLTHNTLFTELEYRSHQICSFRGVPAREAPLQGVNKRTRHRILIQRADRRQDVIGPPTGLCLSRSRRGAALDEDFESITAIPPHCGWRLSSAGKR